MIQIGASCQHQEVQMKCRFAFGSWLLAFGCMTGLSKYFSILQKIYCAKLVRDGEIVGSSLRLKPGPPRSILSQLIFP